MAVHFDADSSVCFSKDGSKFLKEGKLKSNINLKIAGEEKADYLILCAPRNAEKTGNTCATDPRKVGKPSYGKPSYLVLWTRFGTVKEYKWSGSDWNPQ